MKTTRLFSLMLLASFLFVGQEAKAQLITWRESVIDSTNTAGQDSLGMGYGTNGSAAPFALFTTPTTSKLDVVEGAFLQIGGSIETAICWLVICRSSDPNVVHTYVDPYNLGGSGLISKYEIGPPVSVRSLGTGQFGFPLGLARFEGLASLNISFNAGESGFLALVSDRNRDPFNSFRIGMSNLGPVGVDQEYNTTNTQNWRIPENPSGYNVYGVVPEPSSLIALAIGAASFLRRRRRSTN